MVVRIRAGLALAVMAAAFALVVTPALARQRVITVQTPAAAGPA
jgi:hypothetical protein